MGVVKIPTYVVKRGNSWYVKIPPDIVKTLGLKNKQRVWITLEVGGDGDGE